MNHAWLTNQNKAPNSIINNNIRTARFLSLISTRLLLVQLIMSIRFHAYSRLFIPDCITSQCGKGDIGWKRRGRGWNLVTARHWLGLIPMLICFGCWQWLARAPFRTHISSDPVGTWPATPLATSVRPPAEHNHLYLYPHWRQGHLQTRCPWQAVAPDNCFGSKPLLSLSL